MAKKLETISRIESTEEWNRLVFNDLAARSGQAGEFNDQDWVNARNDFYNRQSVDSLLHVARTNLGVEYSDELTIAPFGSLPK